MFNSVRAAPPDPTCAAVAVRRDNVSWYCGEHPDLGKDHNTLSARLHDIVVAPAPLPEASPGLAPLPDTMIISRHQHRNTPDVTHDASAYVAEQIHAARFGGDPP